MPWLNPFSEGGKPGVEALPVYTDAGADANHPEILGGVAQVIGSAGRDGQQLSDLLHLVNERIESGCTRSVFRFHGRVWRHFHCSGCRTGLQGFTGQIYVLVIITQLRAPLRHLRGKQFRVNCFSPERYGRGRSFSGKLPPILLPVKFFVRELKNTRPIRPSARMRPEPPAWADHRAARRADVVFEKQRYYNESKAFSGWAGA